MIDYFIGWITANWFLTAFIVIFGWAIVRMFRRRKIPEKVVKHTQETQKQAQAAGMDVQQNVSGRTANMTYGTAIEGDTNYAGNTGGIEWKLLSSVRLTTRNSSDAVNSRDLDVRKKSSRWSTPAAAWPAGKFLMLMGTPGYDSAKHTIRRGGFFNKLVQMAGDFALDFYISGYFGSEYKSLVNVGEDGVKIDRPALNNFFILTNHQALAEKFLDEATVNTIANWRKAALGFRNEAGVDNFGLLFCSDGVILGCQADMANADEAKKLADFGSALAIKMQETLKSWS